jgi:pyruvate dehydrogenase (quinone)/pyruvate oxidase
LDGQPVLAITGMAYHDLIGTNGQQDVEMDKLFMDVAVYNQRVMGPTHVQNIVEIACRTAETSRGVAHITFPKDIQEMEINWKRQSSARNTENHVSMVHAESVPLASEQGIRRAAELLNGSRKVCILAGRGALNATSELEQTAAILGAPIVKALLGKAAVPDDSPYTTGTIGLLGTKPSEEALMNCDMLFMVGSAFPYMEFLPRPGRAKSVQIDSNPARISLRYPADVGLVGDSRETLRQLIPLLKTKKDRSFLKKAQSGMQDWREYMERLGTSNNMPMKPQVVAWNLGKRLRSDAIVTCDSGTITTWWARHIPVKRGQMHSLSGNLASMAPGLPYAIAAQLAYPERQVVAFVGDGGFSMLGFELLTAVKYQLPIKIVVIKNDYLGMIKWEQMVMLGKPEFGVKLQTFDFKMFADACGATGIRVEKPGEIGDALDRFLNVPGPAVLEAVVDPLTAPMPAEITPRQALNFAESLARGEPKARKIMREAFRDRARQII